jgi:hypothetical protein
MKKFILTFIILLIISAVNNLTSQVIDTVQYWKFKGNLGLNFSQVGLSNWTGGGKSTISIAGLVNFNLNYNRNNSLWDNTLEFGYGLTKQETPEFRKSDDRIVLTSKYGYNFFDGLSAGLLLDIRTQFNSGYNYDKIDSVTGKPLRISKFLAPGFINLGIGLNYKPVEYVQIMFSPIANRIILVLDNDLSNQGAYGVDPGKKVKSELGSALNVTFNKEIMERVTFQTTLNLFSQFSKMTSLVVNWNTLLNMKVNRFLSASFSTDLFYDEKIQILRDNGTKGPATQFRDVIAIGIAYMLN